MSIPRGEIDLNLEAWKQNRINWYNEQMEKGNIVNWKLFKDPEDPTKGVFYNSIIGWAAAEVNVVKLEAYGLARYYNIVSPGSSSALEAILKEAQQKRQPVFGYYWSPNAPMGAYDWHILEEPPYTDKCWEDIVAAVEDESLRPIDRACAYESFPMDKIAHKNLLKKVPDVVKMLRKMMVGLEPLNKTLAWAKENEIQDWQEATIYYLQEYEDRWKTWVTSGAYKKIKKALKEASS